jgi:transglutaminase domain protein
MNLLKKIVSSVILSTMIFTNVAVSYASEDISVGEINNTILDDVDIGKEAKHKESTTYYKSIDNGIKGIHEQMMTGSIRQMLNGQYKVEDNNNRDGFSKIIMNSRYFNMRGKYTYKEIYDMAYDVSSKMSLMYDKGVNQSYYYQPSIVAYNAKGNVILNQTDRVYQTVINIKFSIPERKIDEIRKETDWIRKFSNTKMKGMSKYQKMVYAHDWITDNTEYITNNEEDGNTLRSVYDSYSIITEGFGVCNAYATLYQKILVYNDIRVLFLEGDSYASGKAVGHVWNKVYVDGKWQNIDVTWDDPIGNTKSQRREYFLVPDSAFEGKRDFDYTYWPRG